MNNEIPLLGRCYGATSKSRVNIECRSFRSRWGIDDDASHIIEGTPITTKIVDIDLVVDRGKGRVVPWEGEVLNDPAFGGTNGFGDCA